MGERVKIPIKLPKFVPPENMLLKQLHIPIDPPIFVVAGENYEFVVVDENE